MSVRLTRLRRATLLLAAAAIAATVVVGQASFAPSVKALYYGSGTDTEYGFDACSLPTTSEMSYLWANTTSWWYGVYIGGSTAQGVGCTFPSASWLNTMNAQGWEFVFIWDGLQAPNCSGTSGFSTNPTTAYAQGEQQAADAWNTLVNTDGVADEADGAVTVDDLEAYESDCANYPWQSAVTSFISGWDHYLSTGWPQVFGVYGSSCGSNLVGLTSSSPVPEFIWGAYTDSNPATTDLACVPSGDWVNSQRLKQYYDGPNGLGVVWFPNTQYAWTVDEDCADGPTSPNGYTYTSC